MNHSFKEHAQILREIAKNPHISQREIALRHRISLGKVNYAIRSLIDKGYIKIQNFAESKTRKKYIYLLTPSGMFETARRTRDFLRWKMEEYERLTHEIQELKEDVDGFGAPGQEEMPPITGSPVSEEQNP